MKKLSLFAASLIFSAGVFAAAADDIVVHDPYIRLAPPNAPASAAFMVLHNKGGHDVRLLKADNPLARATELHTHIDDGGVMRMRPVAAIEIKAGGEAVLKPGGMHIMLIDLKAPLKEGDLVPMTLGFDDGSSKSIEIRVMRMAPMEHMQH